MTIWTCERCLEYGRVCEVTTEGRTGAWPHLCPYGQKGCEWQPAYKGAVQ